MLDAFLASTIAMATPILLAALGELIVEESGIINIGIEGAMLFGAFFGFVAAYFSGSIAVGLIAAVLSAVVLNSIMAALIVNFAVNQVVAGTALDMLALGLTGVLYRRFFGITGQALTINALGPISTGWITRVPIIGPALFNQNAIVYLTLALVPLVHFGLTDTRAGLYLRAVGEHPAAADVLGVPVYTFRWIALLIGGACAGLAGAFLTLAYNNTFVEGISGGRGFVALAVVIVGRWHSWGIAAASILFGAAMALQFTLQSGGVVPYQLLLAMPYALTIVVLAIAGAQAQSPSGLGEPYLRDQ